MLTLKHMMELCEFICLCFIDILFIVKLHLNVRRRCDGKVKVRGPFVQTLCIERDSYMDAI